MKILKVLGILASLFALLCGILYVSSYEKTLPIEGVIVDATTGKPVSKVFVQAFWHFSVPNPVDSTGDEDVYGTVTDEKGRFSIPGKNVTRTFSQFVDLNLHVQHPLYVFERVQVYVDGSYKRGRALSKSLQLPVQLVSLEDKYPPGSDLSELSRVLDDCGPSFYIAMRERFGVRYDIDSILTSLERISNRAAPPNAERNVAHDAFLTHKFLMSNLAPRF